jgi:hypothetical protein
VQNREYSAVLQQDDYSEGQKGVHHQINRSPQYGHHLQTTGGVVKSLAMG